jgi:UV DNA damage endonuclease
VFDYLHHQFCTGDLSEEQAFRLAVSTWPKTITPIVHFSSAKKKHEDPKAVEAAHADYIYTPINCYGRIVDIMLEAKAKEAAVLKFKHDFLEVEA